MPSLTPQRGGFLPAVGSDTSRCLFAGCWRLHVDDSGHAGSVLLCNNQKFVINHNGKEKGTPRLKDVDQQVLDLLIYYTKTLLDRYFFTKDSTHPLTISSTKLMQN